jgi:hypothetical protein
MVIQEPTFFERLTAAVARLFAPAAIASACASATPAPAPERPAEPTAAFTANRDIQIAAFDGAKPVSVVEAGHSYRLVTNGLAKFNRREIEVVGVPVELVAGAASLMNEVANYVVNVKQIEDGKSWAQDYGQTTVAARCFELSSYGQDVLRVVDLENQEPVEVPPLTAITAYSYMKALSLQETGDNEQALELLLLSAKIFPGDPNAQHYTVRTGAIINQQNWLTYVALARAIQEDEARYFRMALERSPELLRYELGAEQLPVIAKGALVKDIKFIVEAAQKGPGGEPWGKRAKDAESAKGADIMSFLISPIVEPGSDGMISRTVNPAPVPFRAFFYEDPVAGSLRQQDAIDLVADLYAKYRADPIGLVLFTRRVTRLYLGETEPGAVFGVASEGSAPRRSEGVAYRPHLKVVSALVADVGRRLAAGMSIPEIRATSGLTSDASLRKTGEAKLAALEEREGSWYRAAIGL